MKKVSALPTLITLGNLLSGFAAITFAMRAASVTSIARIGRTLEGLLSSELEFFYNNILCASLLIGLAMLCDLFDGRVARVTKSTSRFGEEMDSLADLVSFGVAPAFIVKVLIDAHGFPRYYGWVLVAVFVACGALRLARYNVESAGESSEIFNGLPIPAAAGAAVSWVVLWHALAAGELKDLIVGGRSLSWLIAYALPFYVFALGPLMTSRVRYLHLGKKLLKGEKTFPQLVGIVLVIALLALQPEVMVALAFNAYAVAGLVSEAIRLSARARRRSASLGSSGGKPPDDADADDGSAPAAEAPDDLRDIANRN